VFTSRLELHFATSNDLEGAKSSLNPEGSHIAGHHPQLRGSCDYSLCLPLKSRLDSSLPVIDDPQSRTLEMASYLIKPREPTVLSHKAYQELSPTNLLLGAVVRPLLLNDMPRTLTPGPVRQVPTVHVIPGILDIERFNVALSEALSRFPLPAGRLVRPDTPDAPWKVRSRLVSLSPYLEITTECRFG